MIVGKFGKDSLRTFEDSKGLKWTFGYGSGASAEIIVGIQGNRQPETSSVGKPLRKHFETD